MKGAELKMWESRFAHADKVWNERGYAANESPDCEFDMIRAMRMYAGGDHWRGVDGYDGIGSQRTIANSIFETFNTLESQLMARAPRALLFPRSKKPDSANLARISQVAVNYYVQELDMKRHADRAEKDAFVAPFGINVHGYTPPEEHEDDKGRLLHMNGTARVDAPWVRRKPIWDFRGDMFAGTFHPAEMGWCSWRDLMTPDQIRKNENMASPSDEKLHPTRIVDGLGMMPRTLRPEESEDFNAFVEVWTVYDRLERKWFQWTPGLESRILRKPDDWAIPWPDLPVSIVHYNDQMNDPFPVSYAQVLTPIQEERNKTRTMTSRMVRSIRRIPIVNSAGLDPASQEKVKSGDLELVEILMTTGSPRDAIGEVQIGGLPQELLLYDNMLQDDIRELTGQSRMDRAQRINVDSATEAANVQGGSDTQRSRNQTRIEEHWKDIIRKFMQGWRVVGDPNQMIPILSDQTDVQALAQIQGDGLFANGQPMLEVPEDAVRGDYQIEIEVGSTRPRSEREEIARAESWLSVGERFPKIVNLPQAVIDRAVAQGHNPARVMMPGAAMGAAEAAGAEQSEGPAPAAVGAQQGGGGASPLAVLGGGA